MKRLSSFPSMSKLLLSGSGDEKLTATSIKLEQKKKSGRPRKGIMKVRSLPNRLLRRNLPSATSSPTKSRQRRGRSNNLLMGYSKSSEHVKAQHCQVVIDRSTHPIWRCKREGCKGTLTLLGDVKRHIDDVAEARKRAAIKRKQYPSTLVHGSPLSCNVCGKLYQFPFSSLAILALIAQSRGFPMI